MRHALATLALTGTLLATLPVARALPAPADAPAPGAVVVLRAEAAEVDGGVRVENRSGAPNLGFWTDPKGWVAWKARVAAGTYAVVVETASPTPDVAFVIEAAGRELPGKAPGTSSYDEYARSNIGALEIREAGEITVKVRLGDLTAARETRAGETVAYDGALRPIAR